MTSQHTCHALGCNAPCQPRMLMCRTCWSKVPAQLQAEVYRTVRLRRGPQADASWAPWWVAQAEAVAHVANLREPNEERRQLYVDKARDFAKLLETRTR